MIRRLLREPLLHFLVLGGLLFAGWQWQQHSQQRFRIDIDAGEQRRLAATYAQQFGHAADAATLQSLIAQRAREEIQVREALALGLDRDDEIIRRRLVQKYQFLQQDLASAAEPGDAQLGAFYRQHQAQYAVAECVSFTHIYFSPDAGDARAETRARQVLARLLRQPGIRRAPELGDQFPDLYDYAALGTRELERLFGRSQLTETLLTVPEAQWSGPYRSGFGWHLVYVSAHQPARLPPLAEITERVRSDYLRAARERSNEQVFARTAARYSIHVAGAQ